MYITLHRYNEKKFVTLHGAPVPGDVGGNREEAVAKTHSPKLLREVQEFSISYLLSETAIYERSVNYPFTILHGKRGVTHLQHTIVNLGLHLSRGCCCSIGELVWVVCLHYYVSVRKSLQKPSFAIENTSLTSPSCFGMVD